MQETYELSVAIVAYNNKKDVLQAVRSMEECTSSSISKRIYIVDNSVPGIFAKEDFSEYDDVILMPMPMNLGFGHGHNQVLPKLESTYHAIVNPDIILKEDSFSILIKFLEENVASIVAPKLITPDGEMQKAYRHYPTVTDMFLRMFVKKGFEKRKNYHTLDYMDYTKPFQVPFIQGSFLVMKTETFKELNGFDERFFMYMEDADLCKRANAIAPVYYCPYTEVIHKWEKGSHKSKTLFMHHISSMCKYFLKWGFK